ncbi:hypothetical protein EDC94DRAFT_693531 [Helicostylum pulchrum]|nr:hypothetical protein EDC94DRAFT_693531 [Helicostylum pulchrum]
MLAKKLPTEILQDIIYYLSRQDITTCQTICKKWYKTFMPIIYHTVQIVGSIQFQRFFKHTLNNSIYPKGSVYAVGTQIRILSIENGRIEPLTLGQLPLLLPFLQVFVFDGTVLSKESRAEPFGCRREMKNKQELYKVNQNFGAWKYMRQLVQYSGICVPYALLVTSSSLTHISVRFNNVNDTTNSKSSFISLLKNAPLLQSLSMKNMYLDAGELEQIHQNSPNLGSLSLIYVVFLPISQQDFLLQHFQPVKPLQYLEFLNVNFSGDTLSWLEYISKKYTGVKALDIKSPVAEGLAAKYQHQLLQIAVKFTRLKILRLSPFVLGHSFFEMLDRNGRYLTGLSLDDILNTTQLIKGLEALVKSKQTDSIVSLAIHGSCSLLVMNTIRACKNMTTLDLSLPTVSALESIDLDSILKTCEKLTNLTISNAKLSVNQFNSRKQHFKLQSITLKHVVMESDIFEMVRSQCPDLTYVSLIEFATSLDSRNLEIYLPQHELKTLIMDVIRVSRKRRVSRFKVCTKEEEIKWYDLIGHDVCTTTARDDEGFSRTKASKVKVTAHGLDEVSDNKLEQSTHVYVQCKHIRSIYLTALKVK